VLQINFIRFVNKGKAFRRFFNLPPDLLDPLLVHLVNLGADQIHSRVVFAVVFSKSEPSSESLFS